MNKPLDVSAVEVAGESLVAGDRSQVDDRVAAEQPVALVYNGISHVVMMATPGDLEDFALGFSLSENIIRSPTELLDCDSVAGDRGIELQLRVSAEAFAALKVRRRNLTGRTGCGLCGAESLEQALPPLSQVSTEFSCSSAVLIRAFEQMAGQQPLWEVTGSVHAAAFCNGGGELICLREDVGRHNALDKTIGALAREGISPQGVMLVTSRASYEMVSKTASANIPVLAAVSAPTSLAIERARQSRLTLLGHMSAERQVIYTHGERIREIGDNGG